MAASVVIIGAGPAGLSCALWLANLGYRPLVLEHAAQPCGMLRFNHHPNDWLLGFMNETGVSIAEKFLAHIRQKNIALITSASLIAIQQNSGGFSLKYSASQQTQQIDTDFLVIAAGMRSRAPEEFVRLAQQFPQQFLIGAGALHIDDFASGQRVVILGGGDNAFENAWHLARRGVIVDIFFRANARARNEWQIRCDAEPNITIHSHSSITKLLANNQGVQFNSNGETRHADAAALMYGYQPNTDLICKIAPWLESTLDQQGFIKVDAYQQTSLARLYAIGDITDHPFPSLPSAIGQGSTAAKAITQHAESKPL